MRQKLKFIQIQLEQMPIQKSERKTNKYKKIIDIIFSFERSI